MFSNQSAEISLDASCRTIDCVRGDRNESKFLVGSCSPINRQQPNHIYMVHFHADVNELGIDSKILHDTGPVGKVVSSPSNPSLLLTYPENSPSATLWKIPQEVLENDEFHQYDPDDEVAAGSSVSQMQKVSSMVCTGESPLADIAWRDSSSDDSMPSSSGNIVTISSDGTLTQWDASTAIAESTRQVTSARTKVSAFPARFAWDPHGNGDSLAVTDGNSVRILDWRVDKSVPTGTVDTFLAHRSVVTGLDYNPNKPYVLATSGQDGLIKFFDLRAAKHPLLVGRGGHSHWVWNVQYNPFHDQLILSTGTDSLVNLWRVSTISSAPLLTVNDGDDDSSSDTAAPNVRVCRHEHSDAVYGASWSAADAWIYMSLSYDGKALLSHVPSKEKYKILL